MAVSGWYLAMKCLGHGDSGLSMGAPEWKWLEYGAPEWLVCI